MKPPHTPDPAKLICGVLFHPAVPLVDIVRTLAADIGAVDMQSPTWAFDFTDYYCDETGPEIKRVFVAFRRLAAMDELASTKVHTIALEREFAVRFDVGVPRPVNLDPGYVDHNKLVLASTKDNGHRTYLGQGIFADMTLIFKQGEFQPWPWTYPDYASDHHRAFFAEVRERYLAQLRKDHR